MLVGGIQAYGNLSRLEDPEFTINDALVNTPYPGATAAEVEKEVSDKIEKAVQQHLLQAENLNLRQQLDQRFGLDNIIGSDARMRRIFEVIEAVALCPHLQAGCELFSMLLFIPLLYH